MLGKGEWCVMGLMGTHEGPTAPAAESSATTEAAESTSASESPTAPAATAAPESTERNEDWNAAASPPSQQREHDEQDDEKRERIDSTAAALACLARRRADHRGLRPRIQGGLELLREAPRHLERDELDSAAVVTLLECLRRP